MATGWRTPFDICNERDVAIDGEIVEDGVAELLARPIAIRDGNCDQFGLFTGEVCGAGIEKRADGAGRRKKLDVAKQRQFRNGHSTAEALERRIEGDVDSLCGLGTDVLKGNEQHAVFEDEVDDDVWTWFHRCFSILLVGVL